MVRTMPYKNETFLLKISESYLLMSGKIMTLTSVYSCWLLCFTKREGREKQTPVWPVHHCKGIAIAGGLLHLTVSVWKGSRLTGRARAESEGLADWGREVLAL